MCCRSRARMGRTGQMEICFETTSQFGLTKPPAFLEFSYPLCPASKRVAAFNMYGLECRGFNLHAQGWRTPGETRNLKPPRSNLDGPAFPRRAVGGENDLMAAGGLLQVRQSHLAVF